MSAERSYPIRIAALRRAIHRFRSDQSGSATVEFAVVASGLILLCCAIAAICLLLAVASDVQQFAADLSRRSLSYVDRGYDEAEVCAELRNHHVRSLAEVMPLLEPDRVASVNCAFGGTGDTMKVVVSYDIAGTMTQRFGMLVGLNFAELNRAAELVL